MKKAILSIRVSTEDQTHGYSPRDQEDRLKKYCEIKNIFVAKVIISDDSAKENNLQRPDFVEALKFARTHKNIDYLLFTKWSRFARDTTDAYQMIRLLNKAGVEPQAIEQPIDMSIPQNDYLLAFYLTEPHVENKVRSISVKQGMRRALKEGNYMCTAPYGYRNTCDASGRKFIMQQPEEAPVVKWIFETLATGKFSQESVYTMAKKKMGLRITKSPYQNLIRNPVHAGMIRIPEFKTEPATVIKGNHEAIISPEIFYTVQDILNGKLSRPVKTNMEAPALFPLRGFITCPRCGKMLTASSSKGRSKYYSYYHCTSQCAERVAAQAVNNAFIEELQQLKPHPAVKALFSVVLQDMQAQATAERTRELRSKKAEILQLQERQSKALDLLISDSIDTADYNRVKTECELKTASLESAIANMESGHDVAPEISRALDIFENLDQVYISADTEGKRQIIDSIYPGKLVFSGSSFRTGHLNEVAAMIYNSSKALEGKKIAQIDSIEDLGGLVGSLGLEPRLF